MHTIWPVLAVIGMVAFVLTVVLTALKSPDGGTRFDTTGESQ